MPANVPERSAAYRPVAPATYPTVLTTPRGPIEYVETGEGPVVLALHGAMGGHDQALLLARTIGEAGYRYIAVSRPGYLGTPLRAGRTPEDQADLYADALDALGVRRAAVMAVSGGGPSAIQFAVRHPDRCWALVLVSTCGSKLETPIPFSFHVTKRLMRWSWFAETMRRKAARDPGRAAARSIEETTVRARTLADPETGPLLSELLMSTLDRPALRLPGTDNDIVVTRSTDHPLERIATPVLVVHGTADRVVPYEHARVLTTHIPGAELLTIEGGEHVAIFTHREEVRARVTRFLRQHATSRSIGHHDRSYPRSS
jgi:pimeloyl-ACP methyl ester carboxylesterase